VPRLLFLLSGVPPTPKRAKRNYPARHCSKTIATCYCNFAKEFNEVCNLYVTTDDGSYGQKGMVTQCLSDLIENKGKSYTHCIAIGPMIMMKFVCQLTAKYSLPTTVSMNPIMVDGTGMCGACRLNVGGKIKFACVDGPEFDGHQVDFDQAMKRMTMYKTEEGREMLRIQEGDTHNGGCSICGGDK